MGRKNRYIALIAFFACAGSAVAQDYFDDIYYNPKKDKSIAKEVKTSKTLDIINEPVEDTRTTYIANMADMDVDAYNRRGETYYVSQIDTIGSYVENGEDFVYTQQIQKFYNPTIVVDNASILNDVLANGYGNVEIVINDNGLPVFTPWYGYNWVYNGYYNPWNWGVSLSPWGWSIGYTPWYGYNWGWNWGPSWAWGPSWNWGWNWGPSWGWGPGPSPGPRPNAPLATWRPQGNASVGPRPGWSNNSRPGVGNNLPSMGNRNPGATVRPGQSTRPGVGNNNRPGLGNITNRPGANASAQPSGMGVTNNNGRWQYNTTGTTGHRQAGTGVTNTSTRPSVNTNRTSTGTNRSTTTTTRQTTNSSRPSVGTSRAPSRSAGSTSRGTSGGGRSGGGGGGGRHR